MKDPNPTLKISQLAREAALKVDEAFVVSLHAIPPIIQTAINESCKPLVEAMKEISKGKGAFNIDPYEHARNCVEDAKQLAKDALAAHKREHGMEGD